MLQGLDPRRTDAGASRDARPTLVGLVPHDPLHWVRVVLLGCYAVGYLVWVRTEGLIIDRISVAMSVGLFLLFAFLGTPWHRWAQLAVDASLYCLMWFCYEMTRGGADRLGMPYQVALPRDFDRLLFLGTDPTVWLQRRFFNVGQVHWYDMVASFTSYTHFWLPVVALAVLWATSRVQWIRFMKRYEYRLLPPLARHTGDGFTALGFHGFVKGWQASLDWSNAVAAMPSLHTAFALFVPAFFLPMIRPRWLKAVVLLFPVAMLTSLVYFAEHWVIDGLVGAALVGASFLLWNRIERSQRTRRAGRALAALP